MTTIVLKLSVAPIKSKVQPITIEIISPLVQQSKVIIYTLAANSTIANNDKYLDASEKVFLRNNK